MSIPLFSIISDIEMLDFVASNIAATVGVASILSILLYAEEPASLEYCF